MDMSKPMEEKPDSSNEHKDNTMKEMPKAGHSNSHEGHDSKKMLHKKKASKQTDQEMDSMPGMDHNGK